jgi:methylthioribose-1-phosphate isomerase
MRVDGKHFRSIWLEPDGWTVGAIDQRKLPHEFVIAQLATVEAAADAIRSMLVRGAPLIGATAAYGMALAMRAHASDAAIDRAYKLLIATRPTAINLKWALCCKRCRLRRARRPPTPAPTISPSRISTSIRASRDAALP